MEVREAQVKKPTTEEIAQLMAHAEDLVYLQFSESGAMGWAGDVILGAIERLYFEFLTEDVALGDPMTVAGEVVAMLGRMLELPTSNAD